MINVPLTFPPRPVANGYTIAGIFAPDAASAFDNEALYREVMDAVGGYVVEADVSPDRRTYLAEMMEGMRLRARAAEYLLDKHPTDLFVVVFRMIDSAMHYYWADMDPNHPLRPQLDPLLPDALLNAYKLLDGAVGRLVEQAGPETTVFVMSDHGFRAEYKRFAVNKWLREKGWLTLKAGRGTFGPLIGRTIKRLGLTKMAKQTLGKVTGNSWQAAVWSSVDWSKTKVVYGPGPGFYVNLKGRDAEGIVSLEEYDALREALARDNRCLAQLLLPARYSRQW